MNIFVNGTFDILHPGHVRLLSYAKSLGDKLIVGIDGDLRVAQLKGPSRPVNDVEFRKAMLCSIRYVDKVVVFNSDEELTILIQTINPGVMVVGSDYKDKCVIGSQYAKRVEFFERCPEYSTTSIIEGIAYRRSL